LSSKKPAVFLSLVLVLLILPAIPVQGYSIAQTGVVRDYWPTDGWLNTTPEEQGMDSALLDEMMDHIQTRAIRIDSISIVQNGYLVFDEYPRTLYDADREHIIHSCTKSYTGALVGIALAEGYIESLDSKLVDLLPNRTIANLDERKEAITLEHLLTMTAGLEWDEWTEPYDSPLNSHYQMWFASNSVQHILELPMEYDPGEEWVYSSGASHLLGAIVTEATGISLFDYAVEKLFTPLGISSSDIFWPRDNQGYYRASGGAEMLPRDMAKFGYLFLNNGTWDGEQIIPLDWVQQSAATLVSFGFFEGYSYQWWTYSSPVANVYSANGFRGQYIFVVPSLDMVVVFTSSVPPYEEYPQLTLLFEYIIPAAINEIPSQITAANTITMGAIVMIIFPALFAGANYRLRIRTQTSESSTNQEIIQK
jgi:CubicO group peptidase (beta-lactamase class C family)